MSAPTLIFLKDGEQIEKLTGAKKGGQMLKKIASAARMDIEELLGVKVNLQCWVKVREDWRDNEQLLNSLGFAKP